MANRPCFRDLDGALWRGHEWYGAVLAGLTCLRRTSIMASLAAGGKNLPVTACHGRMDLLTRTDARSRLEATLSPTLGA